MNFLQFYNVGQNGHTPLLEKICINLPLFAKYLAMYHFFKTRFCRNRVFHGTQFMKLEYHEFFFKFFEVTRVHGTRFCEFHEL